MMGWRLDRHSSSDYKNNQGEVVVVEEKVVKKLDEVRKMIHTAAEVGSSSKKPITTTTTTGKTSTTLFRCLPRRTGSSTSSQPLSRGLLRKIWGKRNRRKKYDETTLPLSGSSPWDSEYYPSSIDSSFDCTVKSLSCGKDHEVTISSLSTPILRLGSQSNKISVDQLGQPETISSSDTPSGKQPKKNNKTLASNNMKSGLVTSEFYSSHEELASSSTTTTTTVFEIEERGMLPLLSETCKERGLWSRCSASSQPNDGSSSSSSSSNSCDPQPDKRHGDFQTLETVVARKNKTDETSNNNSTSQMTSSGLFESRVICPNSDYPGELRIRHNNTPTNRHTPFLFPVCAADRNTETTHLRPLSRFVLAKHRSSCVMKSNDYYKLSAARPVISTTPSEGDSATWANLIAVAVENTGSTLGLSWTAITDARIREAAGSSPLLLQRSLL